MNITLEQISELDHTQILYLDTRSLIAYKHGHIKGALCFEEWKDRINELPADKTLIVYCSFGEQSHFVAKQLKELGFHVYNLSGGYRSWLLENFEQLSNEEVERYNRQMILPQMGDQGQVKLKNASVLIVGAGGLGSPAALYLAGAGVGRIGLVDADEVNLSNLHRQIIHTTKNTGVNKAESAKQQMLELNPLIQVDTYPYFLTPDNAEEIIGSYDFIIDAVDNFETKFLINDTCVLQKKPFCHAGILQFEGQVMTYVPGDQPCYRCIFEEIPEEGSIPNCSQAGIIGAVAGIIGCMQALEAIKYLVGIDQLLTGKMLVFDGLSMKMRIAKFGKKNCACKVCSDTTSIRSIQENADEYTQKACKLSI
jgi:molybdopterin/thiamine biosynthesis adenylyltransferase